MTLTDLYRKALEKLQIVAAGEPVDPDDHQLMASKYTALHAMLLGKGLVSWALVDPVPEFSVIPLTAMLAWAAADDFGQESNSYAAEGSLDLLQISLAERQLRRQLASEVVSYPAASEYF